MRKPIFIIICLFLSYACLAQDKSLYQKHWFTQSGDTMPYRILFPKNYDSTKKYPAIFFLHGRGESGSDNEKQLVHDAIKYIFSPFKLSAANAKAAFKSSEVICGCADKISFCVSPADSFSSSSSTEIRVPFITGFPISIFGFTSIWSDIFITKVYDGANAVSNLLKLCNSIIWQV